MIKKFAMCSMPASNEFTNEPEKLPELDEKVASDKRLLNIEETPKEVKIQPATLGVIVCIWPDKLIPWMLKEAA